jgi:2-polyprenyl-6-methoxyphenol hydroxylase-like FAD-dependent oxidoreductase
MASQGSSSSIKVLIVGGGIVGLTLANALQHADIDYVLLESHDTVTPRVGATICIFPHGSRILDQLGCYERLWENTVPLTTIHEHDHNGNLFRSEPSDVFEWLAKRTGYQTPFIDRHHILDVLYDAILDKSKIITGKLITRIEEMQHDVTAVCDDGTEYHGTVLAGTDGVHSKVRDEMWRIADEKIPGFIPATDKTAQRAEFRCLFGVAHPPFMAPRGSAYYTFRKGISSATVFGKDGVVYFFLFDKLDRVYEHDEIPRYSDDDAEKFAESVADFPIQSEKEFAGKVVFRDLWKSKKSSTLVATEEARYEKWTFGRIALLGDSVHKGTPNAGPGGNGGIESAAAFANVLYCLRHRSRDPSRDQIITALTNYEHKRKHRANSYLDSARFFTDLNSLATWPHRLATWYMSDMWENASVELWSDQCQNAPKIDYLPTPKRSLHGWMPFNEQEGVGMKEALGSRLLRALVFLILPCWAHQTVCVWLPASSFMEISDIDHQMSRAEFSIIHFIMLIESSRRLANAWTLTAL